MVRYLARDWTARGIDVTVYCRERPGRARSWQHDGVTCRWTPGLESTSFSTLSYGLTSHLAAAFAGFDVALVVNVANGYFLPALRLGGIPSAINTDGIEWERGKWGGVARKVFRVGAEAAARFADVTIADSREIARIWKREFGVDSEFIPYGAPVLESVPADRVAMLGLEPGGYSLVVARLVPENNIDLALDALTGGEVPLVVVGSGTGGTPIEERLSAMSGRGEVRWLGHVSDQDLLKQLWAHAEIYFHGHSVGGTNPALLQALGAGAPTMALDTPFNREVIGNDEQLFAKDAGAVRELAERLRSDPDLRAEWSRTGRSTVATRYSWQDVSDRYLEALALARRRRES
jgi:glycosyltransferase involved in cell wall biosynthesis